MQGKLWKVRSYSFVRDISTYKGILVRESYSLFLEEEGDQISRNSY